MACACVHKRLSTQPAGYYILRHWVLSETYTCLMSARGWNPSSRESWFRLRLKSLNRAIRTSYRISEYRYVRWGLKLPPVWKNHFFLFLDTGWNPSQKMISDLFLVRMKAHSGRLNGDWSPPKEQSYVTISYRLLWFLYKPRWCRQDIHWGSVARNRSFIITPGVTVLIDWNMGDI